MSSLLSRIKKGQVLSLPVNLWGKYSVMFPPEQTFWRTITSHRTPKVDISNVVEDVFGTLIDIERELEDATPPFEAMWLEQKNLGSRARAGHLVLRYNFTPDVSDARAAWIRPGPYRHEVLVLSFFNGPGDMIRDFSDYLCCGPLEFTTYVTDQYGQIAHIGRDKLIEKSDYPLGDVGEVVPVLEAIVRMPLWIG